MYGIYTFSYTVLDPNGGSSVATARVAALEPGVPTPVASEEGMPIPPQPPSAYPISGQDDVFHFGNGELVVPAFRGVLANDMPGTFAVLVSHPGLGHLGQFGDDGAFAYTPSLNGGDTGFTYRVYRNDMQNSQLINVGAKDLGGDIYHGIDPAKVERKFQSTNGAFTAANLNDSDYDGTIDKNDNDVSPRANAPAGYKGGEVDLIKVQIPKPALSNNPVEKLKVPSARAGPRGAVMFRCLFGWAVGVPLAVALSTGAPAGEKPTPPPSPALSDLLKEADQLEKKRVEVGAALLKRATQDKLNKEEAEDAMVALGKLKYAPAVDHVLSRLTVSRAARASEIIHKGRGTHHLFPAIATLWEFGPATVKPLIKAYRARSAELAKVKKPREDDLLLDNIRYALMGKTLAEAAAGHLDKLIETEWQRGVNDSEMEALQDLLKTIRDEGRGR